MRSLVTQTTLTWGCRYLGVGLGIGVVLPFIIEGTIPLLFISPLCGAMVLRGHRRRGWSVLRCGQVGDQGKVAKDDCLSTRTAADGALTRKLERPNQL